jgi:AcrR family transcriptional regulator
VEVVAEKSARSARKAKGAGYLRRAEILDAAEKLFVREGYQGATIRKIAQEVGLSSTALYMHFRDKSEILLEICEGAFSHLRDVNREIAALPLPPEERIRRMLEAYVEFGLANPNAYIVVFGRTLAAPEKGAVLNELGQQVQEPFQAALRELSESAPLRCTPEEATYVCWAACHGLVALMVNSPEIQWPAGSKGMIDKMLDTLICGLRAS